MEITTEQTNGQTKMEASRMPISPDNRRIAITLPGDVARKLQAMAEKEMRSLSSMTALMVIRGLEQVEAQPKHVKNGNGK